MQKRPWHPFSVYVEPCRLVGKAGTTGLTQAQLAQDMVEEECSSLDSAVAALVEAGTLQWAPAFGQQVPFQSLLHTLLHAVW